MTIIVTGGAGFIGSNFIFHMLDKYPDYRIVCLDCLTYAGNLSTLEPVMDNPNFRFVKESITDREAVYKLFEEEKPDMVVNFAAESHVDRSIENPEVFLDTNIKGTAVLMDACRKYGIKRYHQVSTDEVYGDLPLDRPDLFFTEETPIHTSSPYSSSKAAADLLVLAYHRTYGLPVTISRCSNNYGPYHFPEKLIPLMIANALNDKPLRSRNSFFSPKFRTFMSESPQNLAIFSPNPVYLTKNGYGSMVVLSLEEYASLTDNVEMKLDEADRQAAATEERLSHESVFKNVRSVIHGK